MVIGQVYKQGVNFMYALQALKKRYESFIDATNSCYSAKKVRDFLGCTDEEITKIPNEEGLDLKLLELATVMKHLRVDKNWLRTPIKGLKNESPFDRLQSGAIVDLTDLLISVANGDFNG